MIKKYYQKINIHGRNKYVLDFNALRENDNHISIILSERGLQGKTYNAKEHILERWEQFGEKGLWIVNSSTQLQNMAKRFLANHIDNNEKWKEYKITGRGVQDNKTGEIMIYFAALSLFHNYKGGRDAKVKTVIYDEFNENCQLIWKIQVMAFESLLQTFTDPHEDNNSTQIFLLANSKSMAVPILHDLGIKKIEGEETLMRYNSLKVWIYLPVKSEIEMERIRKKWQYDLSKLFQLADASYQNIANFDNFDGVIEEPEHSFIHLYNMVVGYSYFEVYYSPEYQQMYIQDVDKLQEDGKEIAWVDKSNREFGRYEFVGFNNYLTHWLSNKSVFFNSLMTKVCFLSLGSASGKEA